MSKIKGGTRSLFEDMVVKEAISSPTTVAPILTNDVFKSNFHSMITVSPAECKFQRSILTPPAHHRMPSESSLEPSHREPSKEQVHLPLKKIETKKRTSLAMDEQKLGSPRELDIASALKSEDPEQASRVIQ